MRGRDPEMALRVAGPGVEIVLRSAFPGLLRHPQRSHAPEMGQRFFGGSFGAPQGGSRSFIRAMDIRSGSTAWEYPLQGGGFGGSGTLATAGGLVFFGENGGTFTALDSKTGTPIWHFETGQDWRASPMTYMAGGTPYVVLAGQGAYSVLL